MVQIYLLDVSDCLSIDVRLTASPLNTNHTQQTEYGCSTKTDWEFESWFQPAPSQRFRCQELQQACFSPLFVKRCKWERICFSYMICYLWVMFIFPLMFRAGKNRIF